jgi:hypothetical protein
MLILVDFMEIMVPKNYYSNPSNHPQQSLSELRMVSPTRPTPYLKLDTNTIEPGTFFYNFYGVLGKIQCQA